MRTTKLMTTLIAASLLLLGCKDQANSDNQKTSASTIDKPLIQRADRVGQEVEYLKAHFLGSSCMKRFMSALTTTSPSESFVESSYVVSFRESDLIEHSIGYVLMVRNSDHLAYLFKSGGMANESLSYGPIDISECLPAASLLTRSEPNE